MTNLPLVSIIIPIYNRSSIVKTAIDSVLNQSYFYWECLVVDDGSTDDSLEVLKTYQEQDSRIRIYERERLPKGAPTCRNIGLEQAKGEYVIYLDSDDYLLPFCLEQRVEKFREHLSMAFLVFPLAEQGLNKLVKKEIPYYKNYLIPFLSANLPWSIMNPIWKRSFLIDLGGFTEGYPRFNDPELMIRALLKPNVRYKVFNELPYDTVFIPSTKDQNPFSEKVFLSLKKFVPDISKALEQHNKTDYKTYLALYLYLWFKYFYIPSNNKPYNKSIILIGLFFKQRIISLPKSLSFILRVTIFQMSMIFLKAPIDKLSDSSIYMSKSELQ